MKSEQTPRMYVFRVEDGCEHYTYVARDPFEVLRLHLEEYDWITSYEGDDSEISIEWYPPEKVLRVRDMDEETTIEQTCAEWVDYCANEPTMIGCSVF
jgi:hypothetical protein